MLECERQFFAPLQDADWALLIGAKPRGPGMERKDLLDINGQLFEKQVREGGTVWAGGLEAGSLGQRTQPLSCFLDGGWGRHPAHSHTQRPHPPSPLPLRFLQGKAINDVASRDCKILVVGNPCNTNALIAMENAPNIPRKNWHALTRLVCAGMHARGAGWA